MIMNTATIKICLHTTLCTPWTVAGDNLSPWVSTTHVGDPHWILCSWLWCGPMLALTRACGVNQSKKDLCLCLSGFLSSIKIIEKINKKAKPKCIISCVLYIGNLLNAFLWFRLTPLNNLLGCVRHICLRKKNIVSTESPFENWYSKYLDLMNSIIYFSWSPTTYLIIMCHYIITIFFIYLLLKLLMWLGPWPSNKVL